MVILYLKNVGRSFEKSKVCIETIFSIYSKTFNLVFKKWSIKKVQNVYKKYVDHVLKMLHLYWKSVKHVLEFVLLRYTKV